VDSASCVKYSAYGFIYIPRKFRGVFSVYRDVGGRRVFDVPPVSLQVSERSIAGEDINTFAVFPESTVSKFDNLPWSSQVHVREWLDKVGVPLGKNSEDGTVLEQGVINSHKMRFLASRVCFEMLAGAKLPYKRDAFSLETQDGGLFR
jgi:hypothetical protein